MRIGIVVSGWGPSAGGGYTFENDVVLALLSHLHAKSIHDFVVLGPSPSMAIDAPCRYFSFFPHKSGIGRLKSKARTAGRILLDSLNSMLTGRWTDQRDRYASEMTLRFRKLRINCLLYLNPYTVSAVDIPFMVFVWDLNYLSQPFFPEFSWNGEWERRERLFRRMISRAMFVLTGTIVGKNEIVKHFPIAEDRVSVVPFATPSDVITHDPCNLKETLVKYKINEPYLLYPAQFYSHKNHLILLRALEALRRRHQICPLLILAGSDHGNRRHVENQVEELGLKERVRFLGFVPRSDLLDLYRGASMLVFPSYSGPDNIPPLEAFALSCPTICADVLGAREQLGDAALLCSPSDSEAWADSIFSILTDKALNDKLIGNGLHHVSRWTSRDVASKILGYVDKMAAMSELWS